MNKDQLPMDLIGICGFFVLGSEFISLNLTNTLVERGKMKKLAISPISSNQTSDLRPLERRVSVFLRHVKKV